MSSRAKVFRIRGTELWSLVERSARSFARHDMAVYAMALAYRGLFVLFPLSCREHPF